MKKDIERALYSIGALALVVVVTWLFSLTIVSRDTQQARVTSSTASKYPTSDEALKTLMSERARTTSSRDRDFASACVAGAIKCGKIVIEKSALPESNLDFTFYTNVPNYPSFMLDDDATLDNSALPNTQTIFTSPNGNYIVAEMPSPSEYSTVLACSDPSGNSVVLTGSVAAVIINMNAGETVNCTFRNIMVPQEPMACEPDTWTSKMSLAGPARVDAFGFSIGAKGYIGGGSGNGSAFQDFWEFDPETNVWTQKEDFGGGIRNNAVAFSIGDLGYVGTGEGEPFWDPDLNTFVNLYDDFWQYDPVADDWIQKDDFEGGQRTTAVGFSIGSKGYIGTGYHFSSPTYFHDFWQYDPVADDWIQKDDFEGGARQNPIGFGIEMKGYVGLGSSVGPHSDFWQYDPVADDWIQKDDFEGGERSLVVGFSIGPNGYAGTGEGDGIVHQDFWQYDPVADDWIQKDDFEGGERKNAVGFSIGNRGYLGTGTATSWYSSLQDFWEYCP